MTYPDSSPVSIGDHIWWGEGSRVGYVQQIVESKADLKTWGFDEPHLLLSGIHPFDPDGSGYVAYRVSFLEEEGMERPSPAEEEEFQRVVTLARSQKEFMEPFHVLIESGFWIFGTYPAGEFLEFARFGRES